MGQQSLLCSTFTNRMIDDDNENLFLNEIELKINNENERIHLFLVWKEANVKRKKKQICSHGMNWTLSYSHTRFHAYEQ